MGIAAKGRRVQLSVARRMLTDYMWASSAIARVDVTRRVAVTDLVAARGQLQKPASWTAMFVKAFAVVAMEVPELRRVYIKFPRPHLYEYVDSTVAIARECEIDGDLGLLPIRLRRPDDIPLRELSELIRREATAPIEESRFNRRVIMFARLPFWIRRPFLALILNVPRLRRYVFGTYGVSSVALWQTELGTAQSPLPCMLSYGPIEGGHINVRLHFDHRIFDGGLAGRVLSRLEEILNSTIIEELRQE